MNVCVIRGGDNGKRNCFKEFYRAGNRQDLAEGVYDHVATRFPLNRTVTCISDMQNQFCLITDWPRNMAAHLI